MNEKSVEKILLDAANLMEEHGKSVGYVFASRVQPHTRCQWAPTTQWQPGVSVCARGAMFLAVYHTDLEDQSFSRSEIITAEVALQQWLNHTSSRTTGVGYVGWSDRHTQDEVVAGLRDAAEYHTRKGDSG